MKALYKYSSIPTYIWQRVDNDFILFDHNDAAIELTKHKITHIKEIKAKELYQDIPEILEQFNHCFSIKTHTERKICYPFNSNEYLYLIFKCNFIPPDLILVHAQEIPEYIIAQEQLARINKCLLSLGNDTTDNINRLVQLCGEILEATCALYTRLNGDLLFSLGTWNTPQDYNPLDRPDGHICYDIIKRKTKLPVVVRHLQQTQFAKTDPNVIKYKLKTYVGIGVKCKNKYVGSLCAVYKKDFIPNATNKELMGIIASAIEAQENRKQVEDKLQEINEHYRVLYEENPSMYFTIDKNGMILSVNKFGAEQLGYSVEELMGKSVLDLFYNDDKETLRQQLETCLQNPTRITHWELRKVRKDRSLMWVRETVRAMNDFNGKNVILIVCEDITEHIQSEREKTKLLKILTETEKLVTLGQLTSAITHEIKNPLDIIQTKLYLLQQLLIKEYQHHEIWDHIAKIKQQVYRLDKLAKDILNYTKPHSTSFQPVQINKILKRSIESLSEHFSKSIKLETHFEQSLPSILGDSIGLELAFNNLIMNALESIHRKGKIKIVTKIKENNLVEILIEDNGIGIQEDDLSKIFDSFISRKHKKGGTGFGLITCKNIIDQHKGTINIKSQPMKGTAITVTLHINPEI